ncbi:hypothetical protein A3F32_02400 [Candidatus Roizmanbacteria bacterium RIFCSPHIGHO2_12_FULL_42_10]|uniref:DUF304 domain-containing protein n=2 Tax=Candidatus Roizmaniibacteriota TaxID=1752723 RepID=A0A1F7I5U8_9BACT|nr:MAG: hypothetical protein A3D08_03675 [Candidatus Roizmanbacteria bacterium RIFCSPHIGHO2_02_FULL_43_11]OGK38725.1 MAG: hypothetical protein A3F32_02400 [Candidatus Roizmanbacteria bacterium RIFCSPHIGHO2_12_FULL_42_10]
MGPHNSYQKFFHSYIVYPNTTFESQMEDEKLVLLVRQHPVTQLPWIITAIVLFIVPLFANIFVSELLSVRQILFANFFWYCLVFTYIFMNGLYWLFNVGLVTNKRALDVDYTNILFRDVSGTSIEDITDATAKTGGFLRALFQYGDVFVQTPGTLQNIEFLRIPLPDDAVAIINELMEEANA